MKKRSPFAVFLLSFITFGFYTLYWLADTRDVLVKRTNVKVPSFWILLSPIGILFVAAFVAGALGIATGGGYSDRANNLVSTVVGLGTVAVVVPITVYWYWKFAQAVQAYTRGHMSAWATLLLMYLLSAIGLAIIQDALNNAPDDSSTTPAPAAQPTAGMPYYAQPADALQANYQQPMQPMAPPAPQPYWQQPPQPQAPAMPTPGWQQPQPPMPPAPAMAWQSPPAPTAPQSPAPGVPTYDQFGNIIAPSSPTTPAPQGPFQQ